MTAIATDTRQLLRRRFGERHFPVAAGVKVYAGAMIALDNTGYARPARPTATDVIVGVARYSFDNTGGAAGAQSAQGDTGLETEAEYAACMFNSGGADTIALTDIGKDCFAVDDQTVALTNTGGRPRAGKIHNVTSEGVWVRFDQ